MKAAPFRSLLFLLAAAGALTFGTRTDAALVMTLDDLINPSIIIMDGGSGDMNGTTGAITFIGATAGITTSTITATGAPLTNGVNTVGVDISGVHSVGNAGGGELLITVVDTQPLPAGPGILSSEIGGTISDIGAVGHVANAGSAITVLGDFTTSPFSGMTSSPLVHGGGDITVTSALKVAIDGGVVSYNVFTDVTVEPDQMVIPEPATLAYLGISLGALGLRRRRRSA